LEKELTSIFHHYFAVKKRGNGLFLDIVRMIQSQNALKQEDEFLLIDFLITRTRSLKELLLLKNEIALRIQIRLKLPYFDKTNRISK
jgi:hypothetical protein